MAKRPSWIGAAVLAGVVIVVLLAWGVHRSRNGKSAQNPAVPVVTASVRQGRFVVYRSEPGTVTPANSVVVRSRVDGQLTRVAFTGGQKVKQGDVLAEIDPRPFQAQAQLAAGDLARSQSQLANAQDVLKHYQILLSQDSIPRQRVADQQALVSQYAAEVKSEQGRLDSVNLQLASTQITAPISGTVGLRRVDPGSLVSASDARGITTITQSQPSKVTFAIPAQDAPHVLDRLRRGVCIPVEVYGDDPEYPLAVGRLRAANNQVDPATGTVELEAGFANVDDELLPNQFVTAKLPVEVLSSAVLVPAVAIQQGAQGAFVYVVKQDGTAAAVPVTVGAQDATTAVVKSGLVAGAQVVVQGADRLRTGMAVSATQGPEASPAPGIAACNRSEGAAPAPVSPARP